MWRNRTGPPCSVGRPTAHALGGWLARPLAVLQTTTDASEQNNTGPLGGLEITIKCSVDNYYLLAT